MLQRFSIVLLAQPPRTAIPTAASTASPGSSAQVVRRTLVRTVLHILSLALISGCGVYSVSGSLPGHVKTVGVEFFENRTTEGGLEDQLSRALTDRIYRQSQVRYASARAADAVVRGAILRVHEETLTFTGEQATSNRVVVIVKADVWDRVRRRTLWERDELRGQAAYDPAQGLPGRGAAYAQAVDDVAQQVVDGLVSGW